jgi:hypothetical protein
LLVEFVPPKSRSTNNLSNTEYIVIMRREFADALVSAGWITEPEAA